MESDSALPKKGVADRKALGLRPAQEFVSRIGLEGRIGGVVLELGKAYPRSLVCTMFGRCPLDVPICVETSECREP